ncbi:MAG: dethiobiotin synthase [Magnetococcales bacterium]|nr:dethiobiotin synthase [Magnetococcales bacterium]
MDQRGDQRGIFVTGTDTNVGKTVISAWLLHHSRGGYWKPIQSGLDGESDSDAVQRLSGVAAEHFHPSCYRLQAPLSPHESARLDGVTIDLARCQPPRSDRLLIAEGAGGVLVPLNQNDLMIDLMAQLAWPVLVVARSTLGTINHTLLTLTALRQRGLSVIGVIMNGVPNPVNRQAISYYGRVDVVAEFPWLDQLTAATVAAVTFPERILS